MGNAAQKKEKRAFLVLLPKESFLEEISYGYDSAYDRMLGFLYKIQGKMGNLAIIDKSKELYEINCLPFEGLYNWILNPVSFKRIATSYSLPKSTAHGLEEFFLERMVNFVHLRKNI